MQVFFFKYNEHKKNPAKYIHLFDYKFLFTLTVYFFVKL